MELVSRRISHLEIAETEGWAVAKHMEKIQLLMELSEDLQKQLKRARKDAKAEEAEKNQKKQGKSKGFHPYRRGNHFRGGHSGFGRGSGGFSGGPQRGGPKSCWSCGQVGHISMFCPMKSMQAAGASGQMES